ncbi:uncharacterized [Tachysurus ichikawai]
MEDNNSEFTSLHFCMEVSALITCLAGLAMCGQTTAACKWPKWPNWHLRPSAIHLCCHGNNVRTCRPTEGRNQNTVISSAWANTTAALFSSSALPDKGGGFTHTPNAWIILGLTRHYVDPGVSRAVVRHGEAFSHPFLLCCETTEGVTALLLTETHPACSLHLSLFSSPIPRSLPSRAWGNPSRCVTGIDIKPLA